MAVLAKTDCFAYHLGVSKGPVRTIRPTCSALLEIECVKGDCPFYKSVEQERQELISRHGIDDIDKICAQYGYAKEKQREEERAAQEDDTL